MKEDSGALTVKAVLEEGAGGIAGGTRKQELGKMGLTKPVGKFAILYMDPERCEHNLK